MLPCRVIPAATPFDRKAVGGYRRPFLAAMAWSAVWWMPKTLVSPVIRKIFRIRSHVQTRFHQAQPPSSLPLGQELHGRDSCPQPSASSSWPARRGAC